MSRCRLDKGPVSGEKRCSLAPPAASLALTRRRKNSCCTANLPFDSVWTGSCLSLHRPLIVLSCQLVGALPLVILSLCHPPVVLSRQLIVTLFLAVLLLRHPLILSSLSPPPLVAPPSCPLILLSSCRAALPSSCRTSWLSHHYRSRSTHCVAL